MATANIQPALLFILSALIGSSLSSASFAAPTATSAQTTLAPASILTAKSATITKDGLGPQSHEQVQQQVKQNTARLQQLEQLEQANQKALARNQELQLMNDNLTVQVQVLQSERSAQMFLYGAVTLGVGAFIGFLLANFLLNKTKRRW